MALAVKKVENVFLLEGRLTASQVFQIRAFLESKLIEQGGIVISLSGLFDLDLSGAMMLKQLKDFAFQTNKPIKIYAGENKKILGPFSVLEDQHVLAA